MATEVTGGETSPLISATIVRSGKIALVAGGPDRWQPQPAYTLIPLELPGGPPYAGEPLHRAVSRHCHATLGIHARPLTSRQLFGPSPAHRMDRLSPGTEKPPIPLLRFERPLVGAGSDGNQIESVVVRSYLARIEEDPLSTERTCGVLWSSPEAMSSLLRGVPFAEIADLPRGAEWLPNPTYPLPADAFFYVPSEFGERHLVRLIAKYGRGALDGEDFADES